MNTESTFSELVDIALQRDPRLAGMEIAIEKELLHCELLRVLQRGRWLEGLTFQGGTALRLCYGSDRLSEDWGFSGGTGFTAGTMDGLAADLRQALSGRGLDVDVKPPKLLAGRRSDNPAGSTWRISREIRRPCRGRRRQLVKLDIDNAPVYTDKAGAVAQNYGAARMSEILVRVQSREEILAGKLIAFPSSAANRGRPRFRDIWGMNWLTRTGTQSGPTCCARNQLTTAPTGLGWKRPPPRLETSSDQTDSPPK